MDSAEARALVYAAASGWLLVLGLVVLVDSQRPVFMILEHGLYRNTVIALNPWWVWMTLGLVLLWVPLAFLGGIGALALLPGAALAAYPFLGQASVGVAALACFLVTARWGDVNQRVAECLLASLGIYSALTLVHWLILYPLGVETALAELALFEAKVYYLWASVSPWAFLSLFTGLLVRGLQLLFHPSVDEDAPRGSIDLRVLAVLCLVSSCLVLYTMLPGVSPGGIEAGVDFQAYVRELEIVESDPWMFLKVLRGQRPFLFLVLHASRSLLGLGIVETLTYAPLILNPLLVASVYLFTWQVHDRGKAVWASSLMVLGSTFTVAYFAYFLSNLLGLSLVLLCLTLAFRAMEKRSVAALGASLVLGGLALFTHPWTFVHYMIPLAGTLFWLGLAEVRGRRLTLRTVFLVVCVLAAVGFELYKGRFLGLYGGLDAFMGFIRSLTDSSHYVTHLVTGTRIRFGSLLGNTVVMALAFSGVFHLRNRNERDLYLVFLLMGTAAGFLVGNEIIKSRFVFNAPLYILAGLGLEQLLEKGIDRRLTLSALTLYLGSILLRSLAGII